MKAWKDLPEQISDQQTQIRTAKRTHGGAEGPLDSLYARQRRLEQKIERIEASITICRRDIFRIERKQRAETEAPSVLKSSVVQPAEAEALPAELFG